MSNVHVARYAVGGLAVGLVIVVGLVLFRSPGYRRAERRPIELGRTVDGEVESHAEDRPEPADGRHLVTRVIDGDTLVLQNGWTVRLIGVDTPETNHPELPVQRFGEEAAAFTKRTVEGFEVTLELGDPDEDPYGRKLAYVFLDDTLLNLEIIRHGYGYAYTRFAHPRMATFVEAEHEARTKQYGLWNYSLSDGRITNLVNRYEALSVEGRRRLEELWDDLLRECPAEGAKEGNNDAEE